MVKAMVCNCYKLLLSRPGAESLLTALQIRLHETPSAVGTCDLLISSLIVTFRGMSTLSCLGGSCTS